ncbi:MAG: VTT domain-containing protein, partial [Cyanobacteria bacterium REEB65]|nr:VTT domain-containing protein [Cyanobacteria bacterium REEB65]
RTLLRPIVEARLHGRLRELDQGLARGGGFRFVLLFRIVPVLPYSVANYALGATAVRTRDYVSATVLASLPAALLLTHLGAAAARRDPRAIVLFAVALLALAGLAALLSSWTSRPPGRSD